MLWRITPWFAGAQPAARFSEFQESTSGELAGSLLDSLSHNIILTMTASEIRRDMLRHFLATLAYRARKSIVGAPKDFANFDAGNGVRKPIEILSHMSGLLTYANSFYVIGETPTFLIGEWREEVDRLFKKLSDLDRSLELRTELKERDEERLLQGPLSDAMTHIGQLAMLRRLASSPLTKESYDEAPIWIGDLSPPSFD